MPSLIKNVKKCKEGYKAKKQWLKNQFTDRYVFKKLDVRGKVFIEYVPTENAWSPIDAPNYMLINCFWVSGQYKGEALKVVKIASKEQAQNHFVPFTNYTVLMNS